jgi:hypothetical protein
MEFIDGFFQAWGVVQMPSVEDVGFAIGILSILASFIFVACIAVVVVGEGLKTIRRKINQHFVHPFTRRGHVVEPVVRPRRPPR